MILAFWLSLIIIIYTFLGYGFLLYILVLFKRIFKKKIKPTQINPDETPSCTLIIAAYNEESIIEQKISNTLLLSYPEGKLRIIFITDGSTDNTPALVKKFNSVDLMHLPERQGKVAAIHRAVSVSDSEILIFTDANTLLNKDALILIASHYRNPKTGAVAGEKRVSFENKADAGSAGEGFYWKYESQLKQWDSELYSVVGAAGELFSIRRALYEPVENDTILDDFMISMKIAAKGYRIAYEPLAYAVENASANIKEELKRKVRIAAGGIQSIVRLKKLLNILKYGLLSFQFISHRVLRWTITPFLLLVTLGLNIFICIQEGGSTYLILLYGQILFYFLAILGMIFENKELRIKIFFIPYYFCMMNYAVLAGIKRYISNKQSAVWEKAQRKI